MLKIFTSFKDLFQSFPDTPDIGDDEARSDVFRHPDIARMDERALADLPFPSEPRTARVDGVGCCPPPSWSGLTRPSTSH